MENSLVIKEIKQLENYPVYQRNKTNKGLENSLVYKKNPEKWRIL